MQDADIRIIHPPFDSYARVGKQALDDPRLSFKAKGVLAYLLGKPSNWKVRVKDLENHSSDGRDSIRSALKELQANGYAKYHQPRSKGTFEEGVWQIASEPVFEPRTGFPVTVEPDTVIPPITDTDVTENDGNNQESKEAKESAPSCAVVYDPKWKPSTLSKEGQLKLIPVPRDYPSQDEFEDFINEKCGRVGDFRPDIYVKLCREKWHHWNNQYNRWIKIRNWKGFVLGLDDKIEEATA